MEAKQNNKKILKITGIVLGILIVLLTAFHFWFIAHAKDILENLVTSKSHGRLKLKVEKFKFSYFSRKMEIEKAVFFNTDTNTANTAYRFNVRSIRLQVQAILPIIFKKQIRIDSLSLLDPDIIVTRLKEVDKNNQSNDKELSIPGELGKVYKSIQDAIQILDVKRFEIDNAKFTLINKVLPDQQPMIITNLFFHINNFQIDTSELTGKEKILFGENAVLRTRNQDIVFPDGRHRLSFSRFRINLRKKLVEFDSCTITAAKTDSSNASFKVFFDKLLLTHIDFDTLYRNEVIKADSVYCVNPKFEMNVEIEKKSERKIQQPRLDKIIQQLTGNLQLDFVIVENASVNITTLRDGKPSSFTSDHNNFEVQGLNINKDAQKPLTIKSFEMAIRNYENFLRDSSYAMQFDSILFNNNRILLSNFSFRQMNKIKPPNSLSMPYFELRGLSWDDLLFDRNLTAQETTLYYPLIYYTLPANNRQHQRKQNIFQSLAGLSDIVHLENFNIVDGEIHLNLNSSTKLELHNATLSVRTNSLLHSKQPDQVQQSVNYLRFGKGSLQLNDINVQLTDVHYDGKIDNLAAGKLQLMNKNKSTLCTAENLIFNKVVIDDSAKTIMIDSIQWKQANLKTSILPKSKNNTTPSYAILLKNIKGENTRLETNINGKLVTGLLQTISADEFALTERNKPVIINLALTGKNLESADNISKLKMENVQFTDKKNSQFRNVSFTSNKNNNPVSVKIPLLSLTTDVNDLINDKVNMNNVSLSKPVFDINLSQPNIQDNNHELKLPALNIHLLDIQQPKITIRQPGKNGITTIEWNGQAGNSNSLQIDDIKIENNAAPSVLVNQLNISLDQLLFAGAKGKTFEAGEGKIAGNVKTISLQQKENKKWIWSANITSLEGKNFLLDSLGKKSGSLAINNGHLKEFNINSTNFKNLQKMAAENSSFLLSGFNGSYSDKNNFMQWHNAGFNRNNKTFTIDSFTFHPTPGKDSFVARQSFQNDYINLNTGAISVGPVDLDTYIKDSVLNLGKMVLDNVTMTDYRDNRLPFRSGITKLLPTDLIKKRLPGLMSIDTIRLNNANIQYTEVGAKTGEAGTLSVTRMTIKVFPVRNFNLTNADSLRIQANGYLMDTAWMRLRIRESYTDSLSGFFMSLRIKPTDPAILHPVLIPLSSVKLQSGYLDTISMRVIGKEYLAYGEMKMYYHDLKIKFLKNGSEIKKSFLTGLITFVANSFVIKNKNRSRTGTVFFIRDRDRSAINYLIKITLSGVASSVGARSNRKLLNKYKKELRRRNLAAYDYD